MVRSLSQWTKTLSFPSRMSPNRNSKECNVNVHPVTTTTTSSGSSTPPPPTPPRKDKPQNQSMTSSAGSSSPSPPPNVPITEISQIVSVLVGCDLNQLNVCGHLVVRFCATFASSPRHSAASESLFVCTKWMVYRRNRFLRVTDRVKGVWPETATSLLILFLQIPLRGGGESIGILPRRGEEISTFHPDRQSPPTSQSERDCQEVLLSEYSTRKNFQFRTCEWLNYSVGGFQ